MKRISLSALCLPLVLTHCASIVGERNQLVEINSTPDDAEISVTDENGREVFRGKTPTSVTLEKADGYFDGQDYTVLFRKGGFDDRTLLITSGPNGWYILGNLVFGGLVGWLIVDPVTGAMWSLDPDKVNLDLATGVEVEKQEEEEEAARSEAPLRVALLSDVPEAARSHLVPLD